MTSFAAPLPPFESRVGCNIAVICLLVALCVALVGCSSSGDDSVAEMTEETEAVGLEGGLARSPQAAVYATSEEDTVANRLPDGQTVFSPSSAAMYWVDGNPAVAWPDLGAAYVKSFSSDGAGGFRVTFVIEGKEHRAHFKADQYNPDWNAYETFLGDNDNNAWLWSWTDSITANDDDHTDGASFLDYSDVHGWIFGGTSGGPSWISEGAGWQIRGAFAYGLRTMPENLPMGSATFEGEMLGEWWDADKPEFDSHQQIQADVNLEADLDNNTISGRLDEFRIPWWYSESGENEPLVVGSSIEIEITAIDEARFAADWVAKGPMDAPPGETLHGFTGKIIGEFYGPAGEEVSGVLSGQRAAMGDAGDQFIAIGFSTSRAAPDQ